MILVIVTIITIININASVGVKVGGQLTLALVPQISVLAVCLETGINHTTDRLNSEQFGW